MRRGFGLYFIRKKLIFGVTCVFLLALILIFCLSAWGEDVSRGKIRINEVCSSNLSSYILKSGAHPDYIEIYNGSYESMPLKGWHLSDSSDDLKKWAFPNVRIRARSFLLLYTDKLNAEPQEEEPYADLDRHISLMSLITSKMDLSRTGVQKSLAIPLAISSEGETLYISDDRGVLRQVFEVPPLKYNTSYALTEDGGDEAAVLTPTPLKSNSRAKRVAPDISDRPVFSHGSGFYDEEFLLSLSCDEGRVIRYTMDGSVPGLDSPVYRGPILISARKEDAIYSNRRDYSIYFLDYNKSPFRPFDGEIDKCVCVRARVFDEDGNGGPVISRSFFVGFQRNSAYDGYGVISLVTDPEGIWGSKNGIMVIGDRGIADFRRKLALSENAMRFLESHPEIPDDGSVQIEGVRMSDYMDYNYNGRGARWEREADVLFFDEKHELSFEQRMGLRIKGNRTRNFPKKSLSLFIRRFYDGEEGIKERLFSHDYPDRRISLFSGGQDQRTILKDRLHFFLTQGLDFASIEYSRPFYVFLNEEFWGTYLVSDKHDEDSLSRRFGVDSEDVVIIKNKLAATRSKGDYGLYGNFRRYYQTEDLSKPEKYERFQEMMDMDSLIDYYASRIYLDEGMDWPNTNVAMWRCRSGGGEGYEDGRWRFLDFDDNSTMSYDKVSTNTIKIVMEGSSTFGPDDLFVSLMKNKDFRKRFKDRFIEITNDTFDPDRAISILDRLSEEQREAVVYGYGRYYGNTRTYKDYDRDIEDMRKFFKERAGYIVPYVLQYCGDSET